MFSEIKLEPVEVIEQWQTIEACGDTEHEVALRNDTHNTAVQGIFGGISTLTCKISQASRACRSLEVIVQAYWVQCFRDRVIELVSTMPPMDSRRAPSPKPAPTSTSTGLRKNSVIAWASGAATTISVGLDTGRRESSQGWDFIASANITSRSVRRRSRLYVLCGIGSRWLRMHPTHVGDSYWVSLTRRLRGGTLGTHTSG